MPQQYGSVTYGQNPNVSALDLAFSIHTDVDAAFYDVEYPEHEWYKVVQDDQVLSNINPGATSYGYIARDRHGAASFIGNGPNNNIPLVSQTAGANNVPIAYAAVGAVITNEDARQYQFGFNANLANDLGETMRVACDNLVEQTVFFGNADMNFLPLLNYPGISAAMLPEGASGSTEWSSKTPIEVFNDINNALVSVWKNSRTIFKPTTVLVDLDSYALLSQPAVIGNPSSTAVLTSILEYTLNNATIKRLTNRPLEIIPIRYLAGAGTAGTNRMIVMDRSRKNQCLPFPMPFTLSQPVPADLAAKLFTETKFGSYHVRQQGSIAYFDGL